MFFHFPRDSIIQVRILNSVFLFYLLYFYYCLFNKGSNNLNFEIEKSELGSEEKSEL